VRESGTHSGFVVVELRRVYVPIAQFERSGYDLLGLIVGHEQDTEAELRDHRAVAQGQAGTVTIAWDQSRVSSSSFPVVARDSMSVCACVASSSG
jgi:hypothetical protein